MTPEQILKKIMKILTFSDLRETAPSMYAPFTLTGRFVINECGQFLLMPDEEGNPPMYPMFWSGFAPNALCGTSSIAVTSGLLYFSEADPRGDRGQMPVKVYQLSGIWSPVLSMSADQIVDDVSKHIMNNNVQQQQETKQEKNSRT